MGLKSHSGTFKMLENEKIVIAEKAASYFYRRYSNIMEHKEAVSEAWIAVDYADGKFKSGKISRSKFLLVSAYKRLLSAMGRELRYRTFSPLLEYDPAGNTEEDKIIAELDTERVLSDVPEKYREVLVENMRGYTFKHGDKKRNLRDQGIKLLKKKYR